MCNWSLQRKEGTEKTFKEIMAESLLYLMKTISPHTSEAQRISCKYKKTEKSHQGTP